MSHVSPRTPHRPSRASFAGLSVGSALAIVAAALVTGALITAYAGSFSWPFPTLFAVAAIVVTTLVNPRGLFLTVVSFPLLFAVAVVATGFALTQFSPSGIASADALVTLYPLLELFPVLAAVTIGAAVIALVRLALLRRHNRAIERWERAERSRTATTNRRTMQEGRRARERSLTVQELIAQIEARDRRDR